MEKILEILKNSITGLNEIGTRLYSKYGTESYVWRCTIHDIRTDLIRAEEQLKIHESKELSSLMSADIRKEPIEPINKDKVIEVLNKHSYKYYLVEGIMKSDYESIASELCDAGQKEPVNTDKAIIEKYQELVKAWEDTSIMAGASKHLKMTERISKIEQELQALKAE